MCQGGVPPPLFGHQWSGNLMLPQKFTIFVAQKLWNWRPFNQKISAARAIYSNLNVNWPQSIKVRPPLFKSLGTGLLVMRQSQSLAWGEKRPIWIPTFCLTSCGGKKSSIPERDSVSKANKNGLCGRIHWPISAWGCTPEYWCWYIAMFLPL